MLAYLIVTITYKVKKNIKIDRYKKSINQKEKQENNKEKLNELKSKFIKAQLSGINRIAFINGLKKEIEHYINKSQTEEE